jgi:Mg2+-importing ATPase
MLPRNFHLGSQRRVAAVGLSPVLAELAVAESAQVYERLASSPDGLSEEEAERRLRLHGPNVVAAEQRHGRLRLLLRALSSPLVLLLAALAAISLASGDAESAAVMLLMIVLGVALRFMQEARAGAAAEKLRAMIRVTATVLRGGRPVEEPLLATWCTCRRATWFRPTCGSCRAATSSSRRRA